MQIANTKDAALYRSERYCRASFSYKLLAHAAMKPKALAVFIVSIAVSAPLGSPAGSGQESPVGPFDGHTDVGSPKLAGSVAYDPAKQEYALTGSGTNMWFGSDQFQFVWKRMKRDFILRTRVEFVGRGVDPHRKVGWMVRPDLEPDSPYADCAEHGDGLTSLQFRRAKGANTEQIILSVTNADVIQFERKGTTYTFSAARYGQPFVSASLPDLAVGDDVYAGLFLCSHNGNVTEKAMFRDVRIIRPAKDGFVPYRDYIGSLLEILDVQTGRLELVQAFAQPIEAPI